MPESSDSIERRILSMEPGLQDSVKILGAQLVELHVVWQQYRELYADGSTIEVLNRTAGLFFKIVQDELWDSMLLGICRMLDPAEQGRGKKLRTNLTLYSLPILINDALLKENVTQALVDAAQLAAFAKDHRDKRIAHQDHGYAINPALFEMSGVSRQDVENTLKALRKVLQLVEAYYNDVDVRYEKNVLVSGADRLIVALKRLERLEKKAIKDE
jgi:nitrogen-specific signal transduction histidine kinase